MSTNFLKCTEHASMIGSSNRDTAEWLAMFDHMLLVSLCPPAEALQALPAGCYRACRLMSEGRIALRLVDGNCPGASGIALTGAHWAVLR